MSDKERTSITIDKDVYEYLSQSEVNQSGLINELVKEYKDNQNRQVAALELRYNHLIDEGEDLQDRAEDKFEKAAEVKELLEEAKGKDSKQLQEAIDALGSIPEEKLEPDNPAVQNWAAKLNMDEGSLIEKVQQ